MSDSPAIPPLGLTRGLDDVERARAAAARGDTQVAAKKFESLLATQLVKEMRRGMGEGFFGSGAGSDVFEGWFDEHLGSALANSGALDLASAVRVGLAQKQNDKEQP